MATVHSILSRKGRLVVTIDADQSVLAAANKMNERAIGGLVVIEDGRMIGIVTERDIMRRVVAAERNPALTPVREVMTAPVACCKPETSLLECRTVMTERRIRHLPVVDEQGLRGIVTIGDLMAQEVGEHQATVEYLSSYIFGTNR
ncbi:MAG TPA: CBS domain-containing protein [Candidatus Eisenbacteria bacterium]|nr:CBS domain-containing protein [Candidatus Eisenbacteria bacterium]